MSKVVLYHATPYENLLSIYSKGILPSKIEGSVYLAETDEDAVKFIALRGCKDILTVEVEVDDKLVTESFDHNYQVFKCRAFTHEGVITPSNFKELRRWKL